MPFRLFHFITSCIIAGLTLNSLSNSNQFQFNVIVAIITSTFQLHKPESFTRVLHAMCANTHHARRNIHSCPCAPNTHVCVCQHLGWKSPGARCPLSQPARRKHNRVHGGCSLHSPNEIVISWPNTIVSYSRYRPSQIV